MDLKIKNKICIITGGAKGIGYGIAKLWALEGGIPIIFSRSEISKEKDDELKDICGNYGFYQIDLKNTEQISTLVKSVVNIYGGIYALVNNAGANDNLHIEDATTEELIKSYENNLFHYYTMTKECLPYIKKQQGSILNITSKTGLTGQGRTSAYASAKAAQIGFTREWACAFAKDNIRVNAIAPAEVMTPLYEKWLSNFPNPKAQYEKIAKCIPLGHRFTTIEEIANTAVFTLSPLASHTTGQILTPDGGYIHLDRALNWDEI
ncbi:MULTISPECIES: SDR family oxidoreductase [Campylobacter]|uniref:SDR family oxidoreductase n=1 Tax=Campylobacter lari TaxID=201 RepID=A0A7U7ZNH5_CAMLA|nr:MULTISPECIES: SDR family oxidoreductase [Campylobacter]MCR8708848.1 SDR family oxidoreductase [Campylobacter sp. RM5063]EAI3906146.1 SDR family oxidoreductase [Campylobacter lari]EAI3914741.1 SDR family oxidoreductase [Campylobacter lari]EAI4441779.1 SDR family oxidoreductase [Campylobacter lari]EAI8629977.1 SDR family oxidoreductase [Campylobacter lari]